MAIAAPRKILRLGTKDEVPSLLTMVAAFLRISFPMAGPAIPGIKTCEKIRTPCSLPDLPMGVLSLITAPKTAIPERYPLIIRREPKNTGSVVLVRYSTA